MKKTSTIINLFLALIAINSYGQLTAGLKAYYPFGGNVNDLSGQNNNGNLVGTLTLVSDRFGNPACAYQFPGNSTNYINVNYSSDFNIPVTGQFSISLWLQGGTQDIGDFEILFEKENPLINPVPSDYHLALYDGNSPSFGSLYSPIVISFNNSDPNPNPNWHHVVAIYDNKKWYIYEDNVLKDSDISQEYGIYQSTNNITIGKDFMGKLDDIRFYDRVLSLSEINEIYNLPGSCESLSIEEESLANNLSISPNPVKNILHAVFKNNNEKNIIYLYDMTGREVKKFETNLSDILIDISDLTEGIYLIKYLNGENILTKIIVKKS